MPDNDAKQTEQQTKPWNPSKEWIMQAWARADKWTKIKAEIQLNGLFDLKTGRRQLAEQQQQRERYHKEMAWLRAKDPTGVRCKEFERIYNRKPTYPSDPLWSTFCMAADEFELDPTGEYRKKFRRKYGREPYRFVDMDYQEFCFEQRLPQLVAQAVQMFQQTVDIFKTPKQSTETHKEAPPAESQILRLSTVAPFSVPPAALVQSAIPETKTQRKERRREEVQSCLSNWSTCRQVVADAAFTTTDPLARLSEFESGKWTDRAKSSKAVYRVLKSGRDPADLIKEREIKG